MSKAVSVLQRTKQADGSYIITLPINTSDEVYTDIDAGQTLSMTLATIANVINENGLTLIEDLSTILVKIAGLVDEDLNLNHIYRNVFRDSNNLNIREGRFVPGMIKGNRVNFSLLEPIRTDDCPLQVFIRDVKQIVDSTEMKVELTVNAFDTNPTWVDVTNAYLTNNGKVSVSAPPNKENNGHWGINVRYTMISPSQEVSISDLTIGRL